MLYLHSLATNVSIYTFFVVGPLSKLAEYFFCWRLHKYDVLHLCGINSKHSNIYKKKEKKGGGGLQWWHHKFLLQESCNNIGCDDEEEDEVDNDDNMKYTEDAIDNMILEFSRD